MCVLDRPVLLAIRRRPAHSLPVRVPREYMRRATQGKPLLVGELGAALLTTASRKVKRCGMLQSTNALAKLTGFDRETVAKRLTAAKLHVEIKGDLKTSAREYESTVALPILYGVDPDNPGEKITNQEAVRRLTIARERQVTVETEVKSSERLHRDDLEEIIGECFGDIAAIVKSRADALGRDATSDLLGKLREACKKLCIAPTPSV